MTRWALLLLGAYIALGLSPIDERKAMRAAVVLTVIVIGGVSLKHGMA